MDTRHITAEYRLQHWAEILREKNESGLSVKAYCERAGFHPNIYYYWQRKLRNAVCAHLAESGAGLAQTGMVPRGFAEVELAVPNWEPPLADKGISVGVIVEVSGMRISADKAYPVAQLAELLKGVMSVC